MALRSYPRQIQVGTNWTCNLKCTFCRLTQEETQARLRPMPPRDREISRRVLDALMEVLPYAETFQLTPPGEPLMWSGLPDLLEQCARTETGNLTLTTNGLMLSEEKAELLVRSGVDLVYVPIDSCDPETYARMRFGGTLEKVEAGLERLNRWKDRLKKNHPRLVMALTFLRTNIEHLPAMVEFAKRHRFEEISVQLMEIENPEMAPDFLGNHIEILKQAIEKALLRGEEIGQRVRVHLAIKNLLTAHRVEEGETESLRDLSTRGLSLIEKCHYPWCFMLVDTDGDVRPCCWADVSWGNLN